MQPLPEELWIKSRVYSSEAVYNTRYIAGVLREVIMDVLTTLRQHLPLSRSPGPSPYEYQACGARFAAQRQVCPACGSYIIERTDWPRLDH
jgi:hypothetical protein